MAGAGAGPSLYNRTHSTMAVPTFRGSPETGARALLHAATPRP